MNSQIYKTPVAIIMAITACFWNMSLKSQTYYSRFATPAAGTNYSYAVGGICIGCYVSNPSYAGTMSMTDSARIYMTVGVANSIVFRLKLTDTANDKAGVVVGNTTGLLNVSVLSAVTLKTYLGGVHQESFNGGSLLNLSILVGNKQKIQASVTKKFDEVQFEISNAVSALWDLNMYYAYGISLAPLPVNLVSFDVRNLKHNKIEVKWQVTNESANKGYHLFYSADGLKYSKLEYLPVAPGGNPVNTYQYLHSFPPDGAGSRFYYIVTEDLYGHMFKQEVRSILSGNDQTLACTIFPNPIVNQLNFEMKEPVLLVTIYDHIGKVIVEQNCVDQKSQTISFEDYLPGHYLMHVVYEDGRSETLPFVKS